MPRIVLWGTKRRTRPATGPVRRFHKTRARAGPGPARAAGSLVESGGYAGKAIASSDARCRLDPRSRARPRLLFDELSVAGPVTRHQNHDGLVSCLREMRLTRRLGVHAAGGQFLEPLGSEASAISHLPVARQHRDGAVVAM